VVPYKHRPIWVSGIFISGLSMLGFGPVVAQALGDHTAAGWRWCFYLGIIVSGQQLRSCKIAYCTNTSHRGNRPSAFLLLLSSRVSFASQTPRTLGANKTTGLFWDRPVRLWLDPVSDGTRLGRHEIPVAFRPCHRHNCCWRMLSSCLCSMG